MAVVAPSNALYQKAKDLNVRRTQDWKRLGMSTGAAVAGALQGQDPRAIAAGFWPAQGKPVDPMAKAGFQKELIDAMQAADDSRRSDRAGLIGKLTSNDDLLDKILQVAGAYGGSAQSAWAQTVNGYREQRTGLVKNAAATLEKIATESLGGNTQRVDAAADRLYGLLGGAAGPDASFASELMGESGDMTALERQALFEKLEARGMLEGRSVGEVLEGLSTNGDYNAAQALRLYLDSDDRILDTTKKALQAGDVLLYTEIDKMPKGTALGSDYLVKVVKDLMAIPGLDASPEEKEKLVNDMLKKLDPEQNGGDPSAAARYADLLDSMDSEAAPANLAEARKRLLEDDEFKGWMQQNGFQDPGMALHELRKLLRARANNARQSDMEMVRQRRLAEVGPDTGKRSPTQEAASKGSETPAPVQGGVAWTVDDQGRLYEVDGGKLTLLEEGSPEYDESSNQLDAAIKRSPEKLSEILVDYATVSKQAEQAAKPAPAPAPAPAVAMPQPAVRGGAVQRGTRLVSDALKRRREKKVFEALNEADDVLAVNADEPTFR